MSIAIEIFCCAGGMAEGFRRAGITFDLAFDKSEDACASYEANLHHKPIRVDVHDLLRLACAGWRPDVWLFVADPPCTPWSTGGKGEGLADPRDCMHATVDLIAELRPLCYLIGNVPGLQNANNEDALRQTIGRLSKHGYCTADFVQLDAADFGVPQHRVRPFWFGHRRGTPCLTWPTRTHGPVTGPQLPGLGLEPWVTAGAALADIPDDELGKLTYVEEHGNAHPNEIVPDAPARTQNANPEGCSVLRLPLGGSGKTKTTAADKPARTVTASASRAGNVLKTPKGSKLSDEGKPARTQTTVANGALRVHPRHPLSEPDMPARTQTTAEGGGAKGTVLRVTGTWLDARPSLTITADRRMGHPGRNEPGKKRTFDNAIVLSERARARLQSFPDGWVFSGKHKKTRNQQIGMAMPPPLAHAIAAAIVRWKQALDERAEEA